MKKKRRRGEISVNEKRWAEVLYKRGLTQEQIEQLTGISQAHISRMRKKGDWQDDTLPSLSLSDIIDNIKDMLVKLQLSVLTEKSDGTHDEEFSEPNGVGVQKAVYTMSKLTNQLRDLEEINTAVTLRNEILSMQHFMTWLTKQTKDFSDPLEAAQTYHDLKQKELV